MEQFLKLNYAGHLNVRILASTNVPCRPTTLQMPNLELIETKWVTVWYTYNIFAIFNHFCLVRYYCTIDNRTSVGLRLVYRTSKARP